MRMYFRRLALVFVGVTTVAGCGLNQQDLSTAIRDGIVDAQTQTAKDTHKLYDLGYVVGRSIHFVVSTTTTKEDYVKEEGKSPVKASGLFAGLGAAGGTPVGSSPACTPKSENKVETTKTGEMEIKVVGKQDLNLPGSSSASQDADQNRIVAYVTETKSVTNDQDSKTTSTSIAADGVRSTSVSNSIMPGGTNSFFDSYWSDGRYVYSISGSLSSGTANLPGGVMFKLNPQEGDVWLDGGTLYYVVGTEEVTIGEQTVTATKILMRMVAGDDPTGVDMLDLCTTEENSDPGTAANNTKTLLGLTHCNVPYVGTSITPNIGQTGYIWIYENMLIKRSVTTWTVRLASGFFNSLFVGSHFRTAGEIGYMAAVDTNNPVDNAVDTCEVVQSILPGTTKPYKKVVAYSITETKIERTADKLEDTGVGVIDENATPSSAPTAL